MNERIKELLEKAIDYADATYKYDPSTGFQIQEWDLIRINHFVELIVRECMALCKTSVGNADYNTGRLHCLNNIKEHFGVE